MQPGKAHTTSLILFMGGFLFIIIGMLVIETGPTAGQVISILSIFMFVIAGVFFITGLYIAFKYANCPRCGKWVRGSFFVSYCFNCGRALD